LPLLLQVLEKNESLQTCTIQYTCDNTIDHDVPFALFKSINHISTGLSYANTLFEIRKRIMNIIPNRQDIHNELRKHIDIEFILQMISNNVYSANDAIQLFSYIVKIINTLQSEVNANKLTQWYNCIYSTHIHQYDSRSTTTNQLSWNNFLYYIPIFFEIIFLQLDQIQLEVKYAYYYTLFYDLHIICISMYLLLHYCSWPITIFRLLPHLLQLI
jgi:hypothetical protein